MGVPAWFSDVLLRELRPFIALKDDQIAQLYAHYELLERWNEKINLTSLEPGVELVIRHYCESLFLATHMLQTGGQMSIVDIGSGAGFPGVPIAVLRPEWRVTLVESHQRKSVFLRESTRHLENVSVLAMRAEQVAGVYDYLVARAVHPGDILVNIPRLAANVGLLVGESSYATIKQHDSIAWSDPIRLPWGDRRLCMFGVSRGT